jgi:hypothetical protein
LASLFGKDKLKGSQKINIHNKTNGKKKRCIKVKTLIFLVQIAFVKHVPNTMPGSLTHAPHPLNPQNSLLK